MLHAFLINGFNMVYQQFIAMCDSGCQVCCNWSRFKPGFYVPAGTLRYHAADKHHTPHSYFKLILGQPAQALYAEC